VEGTKIPTSQVAPYKVRWPTDVGRKGPVLSQPHTALTVAFIILIPPDSRPGRGVKVSDLKGKHDEFSSTQRDRGLLKPHTNLADLLKGKKRAFISYVVRERNLEINALRCSPCELESQWSFFVT
jgi:hypothetical protein